jgi:hypothetical protein
MAIVQGLLNSAKQIFGLPMIASFCLFTAAVKQIVTTIFGIKTLQPCSQKTFKLQCWDIPALVKIVKSKK